jgi:hypothetical protein
MRSARARVCLQREYAYTIKRARNILFGAILTSNCQQCICIDMSPTKVSKFMKIMYFDVDITQNARLFFPISLPFSLCQV